MLKIKKHKFIWFSIIVLGVILVGMPAVYADDAFLTDGAVDEAISAPVDEEASAISTEVDKHNQFVFLEKGETFEDYIGSSTSDLVYTPVTPCRIIDTRNAGGIIGPNSGRQFEVNMSNYSSQGGYPGYCGIPINPAAVAINVASTEQTGKGNLRVIVTGGGIPAISSLNYSPGVTISNAGVFRSLETGTYDIFIYSANSASHVVVDIMGYFAPPVATPVDNYVMVSSIVTVGAGATAAVFSPACPTGYRVTGGGHIGTLYTDNWDILSSRPTRNNSTTIYTGFNNTTQWLMQVRNSSSSSRGFQTFGVCARIPGR